MAGYRLIKRHGVEEFEGDDDEIDASSGSTTESTDTAGSTVSSTSSAGTNESDEEVVLQPKTSCTVSPFPRQS